MIFNEQLTVLYDYQKCAQLYFDFGAHDLFSPWFSWPMTANVCVCVCVRASLLFFASPTNILYFPLSFALFLVMLIGTNAIFSSLGHCWIDWQRIEWHTTSK